jgi:hypothetical protein
MNRLAIFVLAGAAPALATITPINQFNGSMSETFESFPNYLQDGNFIFDNGTAIFGGNATANSSANQMVIYSPANGANFNLANGGFAQVSDGVNGLGSNASSQTVEFTFNQKIVDFGGFWGVAHYGNGNSVNVDFFDGNSNVGNANFSWNRNDGVLEWHGWNSDIPFDRVAFTGFFTVADGFQANIPAPGAAALLGLSGLIVARRRR